MEIMTVNLVEAKERPIATGVVAILAVISVGIAIAFATGMTSPAKLYAQVLPPCCSVPPTPPAPPPPPPPPPPAPPAPPAPPVPPIEIPPTPPIIPPPPTTAACDYLTASASEITAGDAVTLTWKTSNADSISIDNGVGPVSPVDSGSVVVYPTGNTTYIATVIGASNSVSCSAPVRIKTPPLTAPTCEFLTASATLIRSGDPVTLSWKYRNATSITIDNGVGTFNTETGSAIVRPTATTTYIGTVSNGTQSVHCQATVRITTTTQPPVSSCVLLSADKTTINSGEAVKLSWVTSNAASVTIDQGVGTFTTATGTATVNPTQNTTYHASVPGDANNTNCTVSITLNTGGGGGGGGGGGSTSGGGGGRSGTRHPIVFFSSSERAPLGAVYLSEIPYTGLDLGPLGTAVYWTVLTLWSLAAAYLILFGAVPFMRRRLAAFGSNVQDVVNSNAAHAQSAGSVSATHTEHNAHAPTTHEAIHAAAVTAAMPHVAPRTAPAPRLEMSGDGFKKFATTGTLTIDDIVKGLSRESGMQFSTESAHDTHEEIHSAPVVHTSEVQEVREESVAYEAPTPAPVYAPAPAREHVRAEAAPVDTEVTSFIASILNGERDVVFGTIRSLNQAGHDVEEFVSHAILALDDAYKARIDGTPVHADVKQVTDHCATPFLERLVTSLTTAVDGSYSMGVTGIKLALTRALAVAQG